MASTWTGSGASTTARVVIASVNDCVHSFDDDDEYYDTDWLYAGDRLVSRWTVTGTHLGELRGLPPTGRSIRVSGVAIDRVVADRFVEEWVDYNLLVVLQQLGVAPA